ncbi:class I mannose-6-phosphate isomerase [Microbacterium hydrocarbonoxydans]|uniref:class I mannose-6-phosphate isomerase n=1 Tax=Microbacterium hydrocarbonoxydans TaxID=273678 RepID=UPI00203AA730|nr:class I mannose-6-phosphate isomerase [Microbacterium hydrocarbonoxydans]MCM3779598.1 class I mannose-6-phosphate isomerase [Microbacterium hydrocarbonoxydans]
MTLRPVILPSNRPAERFYLGGARISAFRGESGSAPREPEDWIGSTTTVNGEREVGLTRLPDGRLLRDAVEADPIGWLGAEHARQWGADTRLLVKLLDAGQRLPVHAHPHDDFAASHLGRAHGKAEAWYILQGGTVYVGLQRDVEATHLADLVARQDVDALLALLHAVDVVPGDVVWVPPGELHAIGQGVLLLELQQPEDLSILLEWEGFAIDGPALGHLGLGFEVALAAVNRRARSPHEVRTLVGAAPASGSVFPSDADRYFRLERMPVDGEAVIDAGFSIVVVAGGALTVGSDPLAAGSTLVVPHAAGALAVAGVGEVLVARPPTP